MTNDVDALLGEALRKLAGREFAPPAWSDAGNLPWDDPDFSERMLRVHLDEKDQAATRPEPQRKLIIDWLVGKLGLDERTYLLDLTCGPGLYAVEFARRGIPVTGIDFAPAAIAHAQRTAAVFRLDDRANFVRADVRLANLGSAAFDAAIMLYGQFTVFRPEEAQTLLAKVRNALTPGGAFVVEILDPEQIDYGHTTWWRTPESGIWGDDPCVDFGERYFDEGAGARVQRHHVLHLGSGELDVVSVSDQVYEPEQFEAMAREAGFAEVEVRRAWDGLDLPEARQWNVYVARVPSRP